MEKKDDLEENFFDDDKIMNKNTSILKNYINTDVLSDNEFNDFIKSLNEESFNYCNSELKFYNICKNKWNIINVKDTTDIAKNKCRMEIISVYNCYKRYGKYL